MTRHSKNVKARLLAALTRDEWATAQDAVMRVGESYDLVAYHLSRLCVAGELERKRQVIEHPYGNGATVRYVYRVPHEQPYAGSIAPPAYRNLRLSENLTGYESTLHAFESLCMAVRR
jgi:hypothetical protein